MCHSRAGFWRGSVASDELTGKKAALGSRTQGPRKSYD
jgi:hypothetical protein